MDFFCDFNSSLGLTLCFLFILDSLLFECSLEWANNGLSPLCFIDALLISLGLRLNLLKIHLNLLLNFLEIDSFQSLNINWPEIDTSSAVDLIDLKYFFLFIGSFLYCFISSFSSWEIITSFYLLFCRLYIWMIGLSLLYTSSNLKYLTSPVFNQVHAWYELNVHLKFLLLKLKLSSILNNLINWITVNLLVSLLFTCKLENRKTFFRNTKGYSTYSLPLFPLLNKCLLTLKLFAIFFNK